jgi:WD40 repeat protein
MEPFSKLFLKMQGGHFDHPDRMFHSVREAWESASEKSNADVKELTPEFFYLPEFLVNCNQFDLGIKQNGVGMDDVELPPWAKGDPHEFIRVHRAALESDHVSANLHHWIDLIFGYKQQGDEAVRSLNVFHHLTYEGAVEIDTIADPVQKNATIGIINNFGQTPKQLFKRPHPPKKVSHRPFGPRALAASACGEGLIMSAHPARHIKSSVGEIVVGDAGKLGVAAVGQRLWPPQYNRCLDFTQADGTVVSFEVGAERDDTCYYEGLHQGAITCALSSSQRRLITGGADTTVRVWTLAGRRPQGQKLSLERTLCGHSATVTALACAAPFHTLVSGSDDETCIVWDLNRLRYLRTLRGMGGPVRALAVSSVNGDIVVCTRDAVFLWSINGTFLARTSARLGMSGGPIVCCCLSDISAWSREGVIFTGHEDGRIHLWALRYRRTDLAVAAALQLPPLSATVGSGVPNMDVAFGGRTLAQALALDDSTGGEALVAESEAAAKNAACLAVMPRADLAQLPPEERVEVWERELTLLVTLSHGFNAEDGSATGSAEVASLTGNSPAKSGRPSMGSSAIGTVGAPLGNHDGTPVTALAVCNEQGKLFTGDAVGRVFSWTLPDVAGRSNDHWVRDSSVACCMKCSAKFTIYERRHHCRSCGGVYCNKCSRREAAIPSMNIHRPVRVCDACYANLVQTPGK